MLPSRVHPPPAACIAAPASLLRGLCVPGAAAASSCATLAPAPLCCLILALQGPCPVSLLRGDAKTSITSTCVPSGTSSVPFAYFSSWLQAFALDFLILEEKILFEIGLLVANRIFYLFLTDPFSLSKVGAMWRDPKPSGSGTRVCSQGVLGAGWEPGAGPAPK